MIRRHIVINRALRAGGCDLFNPSIFGKKEAKSLHPSVSTKTPTITDRRVSTFQHKYLLFIQVFTSVMREAAKNARYEA